jgi:hypothetical protein
LEYKTGFGLLPPVKSTFFKEGDIMTTQHLNHVFEEVKNLTSREKAFVAHCLISSLDAIQDENVYEAWTSLAETRYAELISGQVTGVSWEDIKHNLKTDTKP